MEENRREIAFLVRMWLPLGATEPTDWRGTIKAIGSDKQLFVTGTRDVADFIAAHLSTVDQPAPSDKGPQVDPAEGA